MVKIEYAVKVLRDFLEKNGPELLPLKIVQIAEEHSSNFGTEGYRITDKDRTIVGLRYSEFFANGSSDEDYWAAAQMAEGLRNKFEIDFEFLMAKCSEMGWH